MKRLIALVLGFCVFVCGSLAEGYVFEGAADWEYDAQGVRIGIRKVQEDDLTYFVVDITLDDASHLTTARASRWEGLKKGRGTETTSVMAQRYGAVLAINADNYKNHSEGVILRHGEVLRTKETKRQTLAIDPAGELLVYESYDKPKDFAESLTALGVRDSFAFGPILVMDGKAFDYKQTKFKLISTKDSRREPRTAIGQLGPLHYLIIVADGRKEGYSIGMTLPKLQELFVQYGCQTAFNMDGGGSTTLYFNGEVINRPASGGQRALSDILMIQ